MGILTMVCGPTGAGKTTYSLALCNELGAIRFSIDPWMNTLFSQDMTSLDYAWMIERVNRCYEQIWEVSEQILSLQGKVVLDLGFTEKLQRKRFLDRARALDIVPEIHYLDAATEVRKKRIEKRNNEKDSSVYVFDVTPVMFDFMETRFEAPDEEELEYCRKIDHQSHPNDSAPGEK